MADNASRRGATDLGMPLAIVAAVVIGGFFFWLNAQVRAERALEIVEDTTEAGSADSALPAMAGTELVGDLTPLVGQEVRVEPLPVASLLGTQGFWLQLTRNPFLVSYSDELRAESLTVERGEMAAVTGTVRAVNDSVLTAWVESGTMNENDRLVAEFATHFIEASEIRTSPGPGGTP